jgi:hypothetical protein
MLSMQLLLHAAGSICCHSSALFFLSNMMFYYFLLGLIENIPWNILVICDLVANINPGLVVAHL